jgi:hypothetical protein
MFNFFFFNVHDGIPGQVNAMYAYQARRGGHALRSWAGALSIDTASQEAGTRRGRNHWRQTERPKKAVDNMKLALFLISIGLSISRTPVWARVVPRQLHVT